MTKSCVCNKKRNQGPIFDMLSVQVNNESTKKLEQAETEDVPSRVKETWIYVQRQA